MSGVVAFLRRRWPALALVASLALNGFFIGMVVVDSLKHQRRAFNGARFATFELRRFDERLPPAAVERIAADLKPLAPDLEARLKAMRDIRAEIMQLAAAPEPDRAAIDARLAELRAAASAMQQAVQKATYDALFALPSEDRARLAEAPEKG
jgi:uncharacterized membrane protein